MIENPLLGASLSGLTGIQYVQALSQVIIIFALIVASVILLAMLITGGIQWMSAGGDKAKVETARGRITNALIGLTIVFSIYAITSLIKAIFGIDITKLPFDELKIQ